MVDVYLEGGLQIKDVEARRQLLLQTLDFNQAIRLDISGLVSVDTAGVQLLLSFAREAARRGIEIRYAGDAPVLTEALSQLGLTDALRETVSV